MTVYRVWDEPKSASAWESDDLKAKWNGIYWTFDEPTGSMEQYRKDDGICTKWNLLTELSTCTIDASKEVRVTVGTVQSVTCGDPPSETYPQSPKNQIAFIVDRGADLPVKDCNETPMQWK